MIKIKPRIYPRNIYDLLIAIPVSIFQLFLIYLLPMLIVWLLTNNYTAVIITYIFTLLFFIVISVRYLIIDHEGIILKRFLGSPRNILWKNIESVEISNPLNTIVFGWLWPPIPPREMTYSLSAYGHIQITYSGGKKVFFPPKNPNALLDLIVTHKNEALTRQSIGTNNP